ncbi:hypothetical protein CLIB1423_03S03114 [[Candida] railenensis]|uniref:Uncharacterized protein n=1 Tax=[Candida] railenensis TaxID=45579 RepID=A0A9P0QMA3_9ASCO|nr:hypothetical protein CLIB1423_03S03114 [[Candida] railenensis]
MSSPTRYNRSVLSPKPSNTRPSPTKANSFESPIANHRLRLVSPSKSHSQPISRKSSPPKKQQPGQLSFKIFEDPIKPSSQDSAEVREEEDFPSLDKENKSNSKSTPLSNKQNHSDQENILQPSKRGLIRSPSSLSVNRAPLAQLNVHDFPGYITSAFGNGFGSGAHRPMKLTEPWIPPNSNNEQKSLQKFHTGIPSFITPPRNSRYIRLDAVMKDFASTTLTEKYLFRSNVPMFDEEEELREESLQKQQQNEDELEIHLQRKANRIQTRKRSHSVGKNESKLKLVKKNSFTILST